MSFIRMNEFYFLFYMFAFRLFFRMTVIFTLSKLDSVEKEVKDSTTFFFKQIDVFHTGS